MYKNLLFDLDDTILDFKAAEEAAITTVLRTYGFESSPELLSQYSGINLRLWEKLERKEISIDEVLHSRFEIFFETLGKTVSGTETESIFREVINNHAQLVPGAGELLSRWSSDYGIYAISNGLYDTQISRLRKAGIIDLFKGLYISEAVGVNKPDPGFFRHVAREIPDFDPAEALIIGDSLTSDILGGINAGIRTCWFNRFGQPEPSSRNLMPDYEIHHLEELDEVIRS